MHFTGFWTGIREYFNAISFIFRHRLLHFFIYPLVLAIIMITAFTFSLVELVDLVSTPVFRFFEIENPVVGAFYEWETIKYWLANFAKYATVVVIYILLIYLYFKLQKYIVLILMAPLMALLSERVDAILTGREFPFSWPQFFKDVWRGIVISIRNFAIEMGLILAAWIVNLAVSLFFSPLSVVVAPATVVFLFLLSSFYYGAASIDFNAERYRLSVRESVAYLHRNRGLAISNGLFFQLWMYIPFAGMIIAPVTCTVGATLAVRKVEPMEIEK
ncbi:EI24 domain-containing protein [Halocola ammonii]